MANEEMKIAFIRVLEEDAAQFEKLADNLEQLLPHLTGDKKLYEIEVEYRRSLAKQHRLLIELVKNS